MSSKWVKIDQSHTIYPTKVIHRLHIDAPSTYEYYGVDAIPSQPYTISYTNDYQNQHFEYYSKTSNGLPWGGPNGSTATITWYLYDEAMYRSDESQWIVVDGQIVQEFIGDKPPADGDWVSIDLGTKMWNGNPYGDHTGFFKYADYFWAYAGSASAELFTAYSDVVNFNALEPAQMDAIKAGADQYHGIGGNDVVNLPISASLPGWSESTVFYTQTTQEKESYKINGGQFRDNIVVGGAGSENMIGGWHNNTLTLNGGADKFDGSARVLGLYHNTVIFQGKFENYDISASYLSQLLSMTHWNGKIKWNVGNESLEFVDVDYATFKDGGVTVNLETKTNLAIAKDILKDLKNVATALGQKVAKDIIDFAGKAVSVGAALTSSDSLYATSKLAFVEILALPVKAISDGVAEAIPENISRNLYKAQASKFVDIVKTNLGVLYDQIQSGLTPFVDSAASLYGDYLYSKVAPAFVQDVASSLGISVSAGTHFIKDDGIKAVDDLTYHAIDFSKILTPQMPKVPAPVLFHSKVDGSLVFTQGTDAAITYTKVGDFGPEWKFVGSGDFQGSGFHRSIVHNDNDGSLVLIKVVNGSPEYSKVGAFGNEWQLLGSGNFDGQDGQDILVHNSWTGELVFGTLDASDSFSFRQLGFFGNEWSTLRQTDDNGHALNKNGITGDFLGDGHVGVLLHNNNTGEVVIARDVNGTADYRAVGYFDNQWQALASGDFTGDGQADLLVHSVTTGEVVLGQVINGHLSYAHVSAFGNEWQAVGSGDYLNDGNTALMVHNNNTGELVVGDLRNGAMSYQQVSFIGNEWHILT